MKNFVLSIFALFFAISHSLAITISVAYVDETCGNGDGIAWIANINGGIAPYSYLWSNGSINDTILNLSAGNYSVIVTDFNGDTASKSFTIINNANLNVQNSSYVSCSAPGVHPCPFPPCNGAIGWCVTYNGIPMIGGTPPYNITSNIGTTGISANGNPFVTGLCNNDILFVTITDATGCWGDASMVVVGPEYPNPVFQVIGECNSLNNGSVIISNTDYIFQDMGRITDSFYNPLSGWFNFPGNQSFLYDSLSAGDYYLEYTFGGPVSVPCVNYYPFTIPDLGANCDNLQGKVFVDLNNNCAFDSSDINITNSIIEVIPGPYYTITDVEGNYSLNLPYGSYSVSHTLSSSLTPACTNIPTNLTISAINPNLILNFADSSLINFDLEGTLSFGIARPGFNFKNWIRIKNLSYDESGIITATLDYDPLLSFVSANPAPFSTSPGQIVWHLNSINNFQSTNTTVTLNVPANPALIGDTLIATVNVSAANPETDLTNNTKTKSHIITGSFDPNEKHVSPDGAILPALNEWIDYTIFFQNTGNDTAFNIVIIDTLDANLDVTTFVPGPASYSYETELSGQGIVKFIFNDILLPDSIVDEANSHGFVSFQIKTKENLPHNIIISNTADIYFDFNPPITTNAVQNNIDLTLAIESSSTTICAGESVTLNIIDELQNITWNWYSGSCTGALVGTGNSITISPNSTTTYFVRDSAGTIPSNNCFFKTITVNPPVDVSTTLNLNVITASAINANYQWIECNNNYLPIAGETNQSFTATSNGNYAVIVTKNGCSDTSVCIPIVIIDIAELNDNNDILISPNPTTEIITIESKTKEDKEIEITDVLGNVILNNKTSQIKSEINLSENSKGVYFIKVTQGNTFKIIKIVLM